MEEIRGEGEARRFVSTIELSVNFPAANTKLLLDISHSRLNPTEASMLLLLAEEKALMEEKGELKKVHYGESSANSSVQRIAILSETPAVKTPENSDNPELLELLPKIEEAKKTLAELKKMQEEESKRGKSQEKESEEILGKRFSDKHR